MAKKKITKASKRRLLFFGSICILVISYFIINAFSLIINIKSLSAEQQTLENNLLKLQDDEINLNKELGKLKNDEYKARYAREYFLYSKENGEYIFSDVLSEDDEAKEETKHDYKVYNYVIATVILLLLFIVLFILKRRNKKD